MEEKFYELQGDAPGLVWLAQFSDKMPRAYCRQHRLKLIDHDEDLGCLLCPEDKETFMLRFEYESEDAELARQKIFSDHVSKLELVRVDPDGYQVLARETNRKNEDYWIDAKLSNTSKGLQLMVQAGKKDGSGKKVQLFVEPAAERMDFDRGGNDTHPIGIFTQVTAEFKKSKTEVSQSD